VLRDKKVVGVFVLFDAPLHWTAIIAQPNWAIIKGVTLKGGYEYWVATGPEQPCLPNPLATKHAFQGWADTFLLTPAGVRRPASRRQRVGGLAAWYHDYAQAKQPLRLSRSTCPTPTARFRA
jgi:hypothetical protein